MTLYASLGPCTTCNKTLRRYLYREDYQWHCATCLIALNNLAVCEDEVSRLIHAQPSSVSISPQKDAT